MKQRPIGLIDSGLGGFTIFYGLKAVYPKAPLIMLADQKNNPYGPKTVAELEAITIKNIEYFQSLGVDRVLFACNTTSSLVLEKMQAHFKDIEFKGVIDGTVKQLKQADQVAVIATKANIESHAYKNKILKQFPEAQVIEIIAHDLVDYIEGLVDDATIYRYVDELLKASGTADPIILGCTHYPLVLDLFKKSRDVTYIDSTQAMVSELGVWLTDNEGPASILTTGDAAILKHQLQILFDKDEDVKAVLV